MADQTIKKGNVFVISAPSGGGKTTLAEKIISDSQLNCQLSISYTTRSPRAGEKNGSDYFFVSSEEFKSMIDRDEFLEHAKVHGFYYGTHKGQVEQFTLQGKHVILDIDVQGAQKIQAVLPQATLIFIKPPSFEVLKKRLELRGTEDSQKISIRLQNAKNELLKAKKYHYLIVNEELDQAYEDLRNIIQTVVNQEKDD